MPVPVDISRFIDDIASTMLDDILRSPSPVEMGQLMEELETKSSSGGYSLFQKLDSKLLPDRPLCPKCQMRMITVQNPPPAKHECLKCGYVSQAESGKRCGILPDTSYLKLQTHHPTIGNHR
jgi:rubredoxin